MATSLPMTIFRGIVVGLLVGLLLGAYTCILSADYVIQRTDYSISLRYEEAQSRFGIVVLSAFSVVFTAIGPIVAAATFGSWIRHAVYGLIYGVSLVLIVSLLCAAWLNQQPFNPYKTADGTVIAIARVYLVPVALVIGPIVGILIGRLYSSTQSAKPLP